MKRAKRAVSTFDGCNYNPSRNPNQQGWFADDANGRHFRNGAWEPRRGLARGAGIAASGSAVLAITGFLGLGYSLKTIVIQANGQINAGNTPSPGWTT